MSNRIAKRIDDKLDKVAEQLLDLIIAQKDQIPLDQGLDALKTIGAYRLGVRRTSDKDSKDDDESGGPTVKEWRAKLNGGARADA